MIVKRVEQHIVIKNNPDFKQIDNLCFESKNVYNLANYYIRQLFIHLRKDTIEKEHQDFIDEMNQKVIEFNENKEKNLKLKQLKNPEKYESKKFKPMELFSKDKKFPSYDFLDFVFNSNDDSENPYKILPNNSSQQTLKVLFKNWKSFFESLKDYKKHPKKYKSRPNLPKYKHKINGRNLVIFTTQQAVLHGDGFIHFPKKSKLKPLKTTVKNIKQVRIIPNSSCYVIEVIYEKETLEAPKLDKNLYLSIDLGLNNLATLVSNKLGLNPLLINGNPLKSVNQYFNKKKSKLMSFVGDKGTSNRLKKLTLKRNNIIDNYLHHTSRFVINYCLENGLKNIVIGKNNGWKQDINIGKINNQNFVNIPFSKLIQQIEYKAEEVGIKVVAREESYTSKASFFDNDKIPTYKKNDKTNYKFSGKRIKRGLYKSKNNLLINADVNGALNILKKETKEIANAFLKLCNRGCVSQPVSVNPLINKTIKNSKI